MKRLARKCIFEIKCYKPGKPIEEVERELGIKEAIKLASNENPSGPSSAVLKTIKGCLSKLNRYPDDQGFYLTGELAKKFRVSRDNIVLGCGSDEIMELAAKAFILPGDEVVFGDQSFVMYRIIAQMMNAKPVAVPLKNYTYDLDAMGKVINKKTKLVFIANPNNPTGTIVDDKAVRRFVKKAGRNVIIVFDEAYAEYVEDKNYPRTLEIVRNNPNCIMLRTFSKIYSLAGLRIGYGIADSSLVDCLKRVRLPFNTSSIAQVAAVASLREKGWVERVRKTNGLGKKYLYGEIEKMGLEYIPTQTNFIFVKLGAGAGRIAKKLLNKGVIVRDMASFGLQDCIRVTIGNSRENKKFIASLKKVLK